MARTKKTDQKKDGGKTITQGPEQVERNQGSPQEPETAEQGQPPAQEPETEGEGQPSIQEPEAENGGETPAQDQGEDNGVPIEAQRSGFDGERKNESADTEISPQGEIGMQQASSDALASLPNPCVYCGPSVKGVARQYTTYQGGIPDVLRKFIGEHPEALGLIVSTGKFPTMRRLLETPGTMEARLYKTVKERLLGSPRKAGEAGFAGEGGARQKPLRRYGDPV